MNTSDTLHIVDADLTRRANLARMVLAAGRHAEIYANADELMAHAPADGVVILHDDPDAETVPNLISAISDAGTWLPVIAISEHLDRRAIVKAMKAGAVDYLPVPSRFDTLGDAINRTADEVAERRTRRVRAASARQRIDRLTRRERQVLELMAIGGTNKTMARDLGISQNTIEIHRQNMVNKLGALNSVDAARIWFEATNLIAAA